MSGEYKKKFRQLHRRSGMTLRQIAEFLDEVDGDGKYQRVLNWSSGRTKCPDDCLELLERRCEHMEKFKLERQK